jgi:transaldolase
VINAFMLGLEQARENGKDLSTIHSVASFFVSRVDTEIDKRLDAAGSAEAAALKGKAGVANARLAYQIYEEQFATERWQVLAAAGGRPQRPLWASTGVKNPDYPDTLYVTELVAPNVVNTMPEQTLEALADHGKVEGDRVTGTYAEANKVLDDIAQAGISYNEVVELLEEEGLEKFVASWQQLRETVQNALDSVHGARQS